MSLKDVVYTYPVFTSRFMPVTKDAVAPFLHSVVYIPIHKTPKIGKYIQSLNCVNSVTFLDESGYLRLPKTSTMDLVIHFFKKLLP
jgi:hypothetical protein